MKDIAHHRKYAQRKVLQEVRHRNPAQTPKKTKKITRMPAQSSKGRWEGVRFDPHHRKPRTFYRFNWH